jgi:hypothetical protein
LIPLPHLNNTSNLIWRSTLLPTQVLQLLTDQWQLVTTTISSRSGQGQGYITTNNQSVCLGNEPNLGQLTRVCFLLEISFRQLQVCNFVAPSLTDL